VTFLPGYGAAYEVAEALAKQGLLGHLPPVTETAAASGS